ncbi:hypothetical protein [Streptomyces sp. 142MFCol3.1]|uniref:hypothetical protein n=1 Tax=Streptomyces sp. 142MFCol3.1 TaxID=1172179 RepID=UPI00048F8966|nr:hypothetical protein [Streptomyces sp. 142MFCol3.1]
MRIRTSRPVGLLAGIALSAVGLAAVSGCGSQKVAADGDTDRLTDRAQQVAEAWDGSAAAATWRAGYYRMGEAVQLPRGGLHSKADKQAYENRNFILRGELPGDGPQKGQVTWPAGDSLTRPLVGADRSYRALADTHVGGEPHLSVTGAELGKMTVVTSRGPATVPAWLFTLDGYTTPLKQAAAVPSKLPPSPIKAVRDIPGYPLNRLIKITDDGRSVTVIALHGVCDDGAEVGVLETRGSVALSAAVKGHKSGGTCTKQARMRQVTVKLERPVGDRVLLDARTGQPVPYKGLRGISPSSRGN